MLSPRNGFKRKTLIMEGALANGFGANMDSASSSTCRYAVRVGILPRFVGLLHVVVNDRTVGNIPTSLNLVRYNGSADMLPVVAVQESVIFFGSESVQPSNGKYVVEPIVVASVRWQHSWDWSDMGTLSSK